MPDFADLVAMNPFGSDKSTKQAILASLFGRLTSQHYTSCPEYKGILDAMGYDPKKSVSTLSEFPFLPVSLFKKMDLKSIPKEDVFKILTSSGTTGQAVSKIFLDRTTAANQQKALASIFTSFTGAPRMPMLILDCPSVLKNRAMFSARGAGILGFSIFGTDRTYALDDAMNLNIPVIEAFLEKHAGQRVLLFGFTFMVWRHFYKTLRQSSYHPDLSQGMLVHGGGWKKLASEAVSHTQFRECLHDVCGLKSVHDYYGMVEQTGCIYMECEYGHLHASNFSDVITRKAIDFSPCAFGESGIIQVLSVLPESYPGHSLLTEDEGVVLGEDDCPCGRMGKYFIIHGRLKNAEIRGCSDTYAVRF